ncbi:hypothetical protein [Arthrobacter sp. STN4]|uniref:hypothetical protein n=1 Tax=Arthrobacter sp. STN4 TaxID=2923276 RepID=UPI00211A12EE|nr:hypothetical protein [Arthrobacter sp. STN4]MCQ9165991.1 hypothetical protein [Arthrobacter sp. STN4]
MKVKLAFIAGLGTGYVLGTRAGRRGYENLDNLKNTARSLWETEKVQDTVTQVGETLKEGAAKLGTRVIGKFTGPDQAMENAGGPATVQTTAASGTAPQPRGIDHAPDVESDPALNDDLGQDWSDEGGALPSGPSQ